jgi:methylated-DNA-[protein]-cysteine S-methyltransferase
MKNLHGLNNLPVDASYLEMNSPVGELAIVTSAKGLHAVLWDNLKEESDYKKIIDTLPHEANNKLGKKVKTQLQEYFQGKRKKFDLPLALVGTEFQKQAWKQLIKIPYGETICYGEQAARLGDKKKARAVGMANSKNPISIIVPCHRGIGKNGKLTGFAGGLDKKELLLELEARCCSRKV